MIDTGVGVRLRRRPRRPGVLRGHAAGRRAGGPLRSRPRRHRGLRPACASTSASATSATCSTRRRAGRAAHRPRRRTAPHGSAVAAVAARHEPTPGVAPDAGVYAIQVFNPTGQSADFVDILLALDHVADLADAGMDIAAANLSLSSSATYPSHCDTGPGADPDAVAFRAAIQRLRGRGIATTVATGNDAQTGSLGLPACVSNAIAVGPPTSTTRSPTSATAAPRSSSSRPARRRGQRPARPAWTSPGARCSSGPAPRSPLRTWPAPSPCCSRSTRRPACTTSSATCAPPALPPTDPATGATYRRLRLLPPAAGASPAGVLFPADASVAGTAAGRSATSTATASATCSPTRPAARPIGSPTGARAGPRRPLYAVAGTLRARSSGNFRGSGADDILWYAPGSARDSAVDGRLVPHVRSTALTINGSYVPLVGDYDGDGYDDIAWYAPARPLDTLWYGGPSGFTSRPMSVNGVVPGGGGRRGRRRPRRPRVPRPGRRRPTPSGAAPPPAAPGSSPRSRSAAPTSCAPATSTATATTTCCSTRPAPAADSIWRGGPAVGGGGADRRLLAARGLGQRHLPAVGGRRRRRRASTTSSGTRPAAPPTTSGSAGRAAPRRAAASR